MSIVLLGRDGQIGQQLQRSLACLAPRVGPVIAPFVQDNHSRSRLGVLRCLHCQVPRTPKARDSGV